MSRPHFSILLLTLVFLGCLWRPVATARGAKLTADTISVTVTGFRNRTGQLCVSLFSSPKGFPDKYKKAIRIVRCPIKGDRVPIKFAAVPAGEYSIAVLHDENMNNKMDTSFFGIPKEGAGASNNPKPRRGPPQFGDAKFRLKDKPVNLKIKLQYR